MKRSVLLRSSAALAVALGLALALPPEAEGQQTPEQKQLDQALKHMREAGELEQQKKYDEAVRAAEQALALHEKASGRDSPTTLSVLGFLADLHEKRKDFAKAIGFQERVVAQREREKSAGKDKSAEISWTYATERLAQLCSEAGQHDRAIQLYEAALASVERRHGESGETARSLASLAGAWLRKGNLDKAQAIYERAIAMQEKKATGDTGLTGTAVRAKTLFQLAEVHRRQGNTKKAIELLEKSLALKEAAWGAKHGELIDVLFALGSLYAKTGEFGRGEPLVERALAIIEASDGPNGLATASGLLLLATLRDELGDLARADGPHRRALEIRSKALPATHPDVAEAKLGLGRNHLLKGALGQAEPLLVSALETLERAWGPTDPKLAAPLATVAELFRQKGDLARAEKLLDRALAIEEKSRGKNSVEVASVKTSLAKLHESRGDAARAEKRFQEALAIREKALGQTHPLTLRSVLDIAELHRRGGRADKARPLLERALARGEKALGPEHPFVGEVLESLAALAAAEGKVDEAVKAEQRAADVVERNLSLALASGSEAQKRELVATLAASTDLTVGLHAQAAPTDARAKKLALDTILQRKGRVLDVMADSLASIRRALTPDDQKLLDELAVARARLAAASIRGPGEAAADAYRAELAALAAEAEALEAKLGSKSKAFETLEAPATVERVQGLLPDGWTLVETFVYRPRSAKSGAPPRWEAPRYVAYTLDQKGRIGFADLGSAAAIDRAVAKLRKSLASPDSKDHAEVSRALDELVMRPVRKLLGGATKLLISPDGTLNLVPFAALVDEAGEPLVKKYEIAYLTSGRDLLRPRSGRGKTAPPLVVANPAFGRSSATEDDGGGKRSSALAKAVFTPLPGTASEGRALSKVLGDAVLRVDTEATEAVLKQAAAPRVLHVATHGFFLAGKGSAMARGARGLELDAGGAAQPADPTAPRSEPAAFENPLLRSGLALAGANAKKSGQDDGILTALEASSLDLAGTELVVLSACETGLGEVQAGDGVYGLRRAFVIAGAETVVTSLWKVADEQTRDLMVGYYEKLLSGAGRSAALRDVQLAMLTKPATAHPYFWASFVASGEPGPLGASRVGPGSSTASSHEPAAGAPAAPRPPGRVDPGARGCSCDVPGGSDLPLPPVLGLTALAAVTVALRRARWPMRGPLA